jgi:hypothetical protein
MIVFLDNLIGTKLYVIIVVDVKYFKWFKLREQMCCNFKFSERKLWKAPPLIALYVGNFSDTVYVYR